MAAVEAVAKEVLEVEIDLVEEAAAETDLVAEAVEVETEREAAEEAVEVLEAAAQVVAVIKENEETIAQVAMEIETKEEMIAPVTLELPEVEVLMEILAQVEADQVKAQADREVVFLKVEISLNLAENVVENLNQIPVVLAVEEEGIKYIL